MTVKLTLTLDVTYEPNGVPIDQLQAMLESIAQHAASNGMMTGETEAEVDEWKFRVAVGSRSLRYLIAETYTADERKFFGFADRGNGSGFGENGKTLEYDDEAAISYGDVVLTACLPIRSEDGQTEYVYASKWHVDPTSPAGYQFRILF